MKRLLLTLTTVLFLVSIANAQKIPSHVSTDGLVAYYPFDGNANDASGNGNNGTVIGATLTADKNGNADSAYSFDGNDWIQLPHSSSVDFSTSESYTLSCWVLVDADNTVGSVYEKWDDSSNTPYPYILRVYDNNIYSARYIGGSPQDYTTNQTVIANENVLNAESYNNIISVFTPDIIFLYVNGVLVAQISNEMNGGGNTTNNTAITLGRRLNRNNRFFRGDIDDFAIWNRALSPKEIQSLFTSSNADILLNGTVSAENHQIKNVADPTDAQDAVTMSYVDSAIGNNSPTVEDVLTMGNDANGIQLKGLQDPTEAQDAATKAYIDALITSLQDQIDNLDSTTVTD